MNPSPNPLIAWVQENFLRLTSKSPTFFKIWQIITGIPVLIIALPEALRILNIDLPQVFSQHVQTIVSWAATGMFLMAFLPTQSKVVAVDQNGVAVKQTNPDRLPFTTLKEEKVVQKEIQNPGTPFVNTVVLENPVTPKETK